MGSTGASHYVFFDPSGSTSQVGTVSFDSDVFGIIINTQNLEESDFLINTGVNYLNPSLRGLGSGDNVTITGLQTITVDWTASTPGDYIRVLTDFSQGAMVPLPAAVWLFAAPHHYVLLLEAAKVVADYNPLVMLRYRAT